MTPNGDAERRSDRVFSRYAIGGAMAATFYVEPLLTFDLAVFVVLPTSPGGLLSLTSIYEALRARGYAEEGEGVSIEGVPVQFLPVFNALLLEEALTEADGTWHEESPRGSCVPSASWRSVCKPVGRKTANGGAACANKPRWLGNNGLRRF